MCKFCPLQICNVPAISLIILYFLSNRQNGQKVFKCSLRPTSVWSSHCKFRASNALPFSETSNNRRDCQFLQQHLSLFVDGRDSSFFFFLTSAFGRTAKHEPDHPLALFEICVLPLATALKYGSCGVIATPLIQL